MSAREWRAVREGETHAAARTTNNTPESFIVGIGASGALLAGAAIVFVTLVGLVSFNVWPNGQALSVDGNVELSAPTPNSSPSNAAAPVSAAAGLLASTTAGSGGATAGGGTTGGGNGQGGGNDKGGGGKPKSGVTNPPAATPPATDDFTDTTDTSTPSTPGNSSKSPAHPILPAHPERPHQNISEGSKGKDDGTDDESGDVITGKGPFMRPNPPSSTNNSSSNSATTTTTTTTTTRSNGNGYGQRLRSQHRSRSSSTDPRSRPLARQRPSVAGRHALASVRRAHLALEPAQGDCLQLGIVLNGGVGAARRDDELARFPSSLE